MMFLATTALEEFWDTDQQIVFLGEWCKLHARRDYWKKLDYIDIPFMWDRPDDIKHAIEYCDRVYEAALRALTGVLNRIHRLDKDERYYRILLGNWLIGFIHQAYDKYRCLERALRLYPQAGTILLDESHYYFPRDSHEFSRIVAMDEYALQVYSQLLKAMGRQFPSRRLNAPLVSPAGDGHGSRLKKLGYEFVKAVSIRANSLFHQQSLTITDSYFIYDRSRSVVKLLWKGRGKYILDSMRYIVDVPVTVNRELRNTQDLGLRGDEFTRIISRLAIANIPTLFLESFESFRSKVLALPIKKSKVFLTANALHSNAVAKFYWAEHKQDISLLNIVHGGGYEIDERTIPEDYEKSVTDMFYTTGRSKGGERNLPAPRYSILCDKVRQSRPAAGRARVLFAMNEFPRYVYKFQFHPMSSGIVDAVIHGAISFLQEIQSRENLLIRIYPDAKIYGWAYKDRLQEVFPDIKFDDLSAAFDRRLTASDVYVSNNFGTTFMEALAANVPTVLFANSSVYARRLDAQPYFDKLREAKILHESPSSAARHLNSVREDVKGWWQDEVVQSARDAFVSRFAKTSEDWASDWVRELNCVLSECSRP